MPVFTVQLTDECAASLRKDKPSRAGHEQEKALRAAFAPLGLSIQLQQPHLDRLKGKDRKNAYGAVSVGMVPEKRIKDVLAAFEGLSCIRKVAACAGAGEEGFQPASLNKYGCSKLS